MGEKWEAVSIRKQRERKHGGGGGGGGGVQRFDLHYLSGEGSPCRAGAFI